MFISALDLLKTGIGPSSSHTMGPMLAARQFSHLVRHYLATHNISQEMTIRCTLKGSLSATGKGHATDRAIALGLHGYLPVDAAQYDLETLVQRIWNTHSIDITDTQKVLFFATKDIIFDQGKALPEHPNGMIFELLDSQMQPLISETCFSIGGGFISTADEIRELVAPLKMETVNQFPYPFDTAQSMMDMSIESGFSIIDCAWSAWIPTCRCRPV